MEARQTFSGTSASKGLVVLMAIGITAGLAAVGAMATRDLGGSNAGVKSTVQAPAALPLRQDNDYPVLAKPALIDRGAERGFTPSAHTGRRGGAIDSSVGFTPDGNGPTSDLTRVLPSAAPAFPLPALPLWIQKEMGVDQQSSGNIGVDHSYLDQNLTSNPGWDARSVREGHGP
jgi:hypothetical protein